MAGPPFAPEELVRRPDAVFVFDLEDVLVGVGVGIPPLPELFDELVPLRIRQLEEDLAFLPGHDVLDLGIKIGVLRIEPVFQVIETAGGGNGQDQ
jgi:hypothetical protein